jgi:hypothetical protein
VGQYEDARAEAHNALRGVARRRETITYGELVAGIQALQLDPHGGVLAQILDEISTEEHNQGHGMLSAVVIHATDDYLPGPGFFKLADTLGLSASDKVAFHAAELHRVHDAHARA